MSTVTVLVVDDEPDLLLLLRIALEGEGWRVIEARDGAEAIETAGAERLDLVVTDLMMPGVDGFALVERLRADARTAAIPVLVVTAHPDSPRPPGTTVITKPFIVEDLVAVARDLLAAV